METEKIAAIEEKLETLRNKQRVLDKAWRKTGNRDLNRFFIDIIPRLLQVQRCSIFVLDPKTENVWLHCGTDLSERELKVTKHSSMVGEVIASGKSQVKTNMAASAGAHGKVDMKTGFTTYDALCVPIFSVDKSQVVGVIQVLNKRADAGYSQEDIELLERFAFQVQLNIENIFLRQEIVKVSELLGEKIRKLERALIRYGKKTRQPSQFTRGGGADPPGAGRTQLHPALLTRASRRAGRSCGAREMAGAGAQPITSTPPM